MKEYRAKMKALNDNVEKKQISNKYNHRCCESKGGTKTNGSSSNSKSNKNHLRTSEGDRRKS